MSDIFDQIAPSSPQGGGDIFDQIQPDQPGAQPQAASPQQSQPAPAQQPGFFESLGHTLGIGKEEAEQRRQDLQQHPVRTMLEDYPPVKAAEALYHGAQRIGGEIGQARDAYQQGNTPGAVAHGIQAIPFVGAGIKRGAEQLPAQQGIQNPLTPGVLGTVAGTAAQAAPIALGGFEGFRNLVAQRMGVPVKPTAAPEAQPAAEAPAATAEQPGGPAAPSEPTTPGRPSASAPRPLAQPPGTEVGPDGKITLTTEHESLLDKIVADSQGRESQLQQQTAGMAPDQLQALRDKADATARQAFQSGDTQGAAQAAHDSILLDKIIDQQGDAGTPSQDIGGLSPEETATLFPNTLGRGPEPPPPAPEPMPTDPAALLARQQAQANTQAMAQKQAMDQAAKDTANGVQPPPPPMPAGMEKGQITPQAVAKITATIQKAPPDQQGDAIKEAHQQLAKWMTQHGTVQGPDGQVTTVKNPEQAQQIAAKWINDEIVRQQKAADDRQKAQEKTAADAQKAQEKAASDAQKAQDKAQKQADKQQKDREKAGEPTVEQRAKTLLDAYPERDPVAVLQRNLGLNFSDAKGLADRVRQNAPIEAAPKVGGEGHEVIEEARATVDKQVEALQNGTIKVVHIPEGSAYVPKVPEGMKAVDVKAPAAGAGRFIYNPKSIRAATIKEAARAGTHGDLLGHVNTKQQIEQAENPVTVQARDADGTVIQDSAVDGSNPGAVQAQTESLQERHPDAHIAVVAPHEALNERIAESGKGDIFDKIEKEHSSAAENQGGPAAEVEPAPKPAAEAAGPGSVAPEVAGGKVAKGDRVTLTDRSGKERVGTVKYTDGHIVRITADEDKKTYSGAIERVKPLSLSEQEPSKISDVTPKQGAGDKSTQPKQETPAVPSFDELVARRANNPRNLMAPEVRSDEQFLRGGRVPIPATAKGVRELVGKIVRSRYDEAVRVFRELPDKIDGYRAVQVPNGIEDIKAESLGRYWSDKESGAQPYHTNIKGGQTVILKATIDKADLDAAHTIIARMRSATGHDESELNLMDGAKPVNVSYRLPGETEWKPLSVTPPAPAKGAEQEKPSSLSEQGVKATAEAMRKANPASNRTEEQQTKDAEQDVRNNQGQKSVQQDVARQIYKALTPEQLKEYLDEHPEHREIVESLLKEPANGEGVYRGGLPETEREPDSVLPEKQHPAPEGDRGISSGGTEAGIEPVGAERTALKPRPRPDASVGFLGTQYADQILKAGAEAGKKFWDADIAPNMVKLGGGAKEAGVQIAHVLYPRAGANADAQDILSRARGKLESHLFTLEHIDGGLEKFFDKMPREAQLAFIDRYKLGVGQPDPRLQKIETMMRAIDDRSLQAAQRYKPNMTAKENHFRVIWRVIPGTKEPANKTAQFTGTKRPFQGDKGFMKRATLDTISEGIHAGGEPVTTNPWKLFTLAQASIMKFIAAQQAWENAKDLGLRKFVTQGEQPPDGWDKIEDRIADVYFKAASGEGMVNAGHWYGEPGFARLFNNYLSRDRIRQSAVGSALLFAKNLTTAIELSLSPFHAIFESLEAVGSQFGLGVQRVWNNGIRLGEGAELTQGLKEIATSIAAPYLISRTGGNVVRYAESPQQFLGTDRGKAFAKRYPDAVGAMQELFNGGLTWGVQRDFRFDPQKSMLEAAKEGNYVGAVLRAVPWLNTVMMKPLFEAYIPRLKWGLALGLYSEQMIENAEALANGDTTRTEIARKVVDTVENRFGEMNFNNIYWNNTFKSVLQLAFRSVTWKLGNLRGAGSAIGPEMLNSFRDPLEAFRRDWNGGGKGGNNGGSGGGNGRGSMFHPSNVGKYTPKVGMNQGWLLGMLFTTAVIGTILTKFWAHKWPWEMAAEDREEGYSFPGAMALEVIHPRTGRVNDHTGKPERISLPTGLRDFEHMFRDPSGYVKSSSASWASHAYDTLANRDAFKNYVYDPNAPAYQKMAEIFAYNAPKPISLSNLTNHYGAQDTTSKVLKVAGLGNASSSLDYSPAEQKMRSMKQHDPLTPEQVKERDQEQMHPTRKQLHRALKAKDIPYVERLFKGLSYADAREVYNSPDTSDHERQLLHRLMREKRARSLKASR